MERLLDSEILKVGIKSPTAAQEWKYWYTKLQSFSKAIRIVKKKITEHASTTKLFFIKISLK